MAHIYNFDERAADSTEESRRLLGGKGHNLSVMRTELGLPVPPGFTITTSAGRTFLEKGWQDALEVELGQHIARLEDEVGRRFAGPGEPLLVSVRSGAAVSMPGMMDTILNLGLNDETVSALAAACGDPAFAQESLQRFQSMYRRIVGVDEVPSDPWDQLRGAIAAIFRSWNTDRARSYRSREGIPDDLGTAVTIQAMVFGNMDDESATGVLFTRNPANGEASPYGDVLFRAQGEDVVAGTHDTEPVTSLDERLPQIAAELDRHATTLEHHFADVCDIEFTIERARLWLLQVRIGKRSPQAALRIAVEMAEDEGFPLTRSQALERVAHHLVDPPVAVTRVDGALEPLATGLPASPGLVSGRIATTADAAVSMAESGDVILVRPETSPDDVHGMARVTGILTTRGGLASHAAVVARGWGLPAVVGATAVEVRDGRVSIGDRIFEEGETITIDGRTGEVFGGTIETVTTVSAAAETLLAWAEELHIDVSKLVSESPEIVDADSPGYDAAAPDRDTVLRALHIKGFSTAEGLAPVVLSTPPVVEPILATMHEEGLVEPMGDLLRLTEEGKAQAASLMDEDRHDWGLEKANAALDGFLPLDERMKEVVTAWQMREIDGEQVMNDHSDDAYDQRILEEFAELHRDAAEWLEPLTSEMARLSLYVERLQHAATKVDEGDHAFIASPRIDSYHNAWFELHEDLIQLAGRTREDETKAGRA